MHFDLHSYERILENATQDLQRIIGQLINARKSSKVSQREMATKLGLSLSDIQSFEDPSRTQQGLIPALMYAVALGYSLKVQAGPEVACLRLVSLEKGVGKTKPQSSRFTREIHTSHVLYIANFSKQNS